MSINLTRPELHELSPRITVIGVGGAGGNAVNNMIGASLQGVGFVAANTDAQALANSKADHKIQLGVEITEGLGAGSRPEIGRAAAEETIDALEEALAGCHMAFITAGMGGGTGTGAAPVIARLARERNILTVGVVTKPFQFEGARRTAVADDGIAELKEHVDTLIIIPNQNLFRIANEKTTFADAFGMADEVLHSGVRGITDLMVMPGLINLDFADIRTVMADMGKAMMGTGEAEGENRAVEAAEAAISNPLLDDVSMKGAKGVIVNITGGPDLTLFEVDEAANHIRAEVDGDANIIVGSAFNDELAGRMRVSVVATGVGAPLGQMEPATIARPIAHQMVERPGLSVVTERVPAAPLLREKSAGYGARTSLAVDYEAEVDVAEAVAETDEEESFVAPVSEIEPEVTAELEPGSVQESVPESVQDVMPDEDGHHIPDPLMDDVDAFVAQEPALPDQTIEPMGVADPFAEAALANGTTRVDVDVELEADTPDRSVSTPRERILGKSEADVEDVVGARPLSLFERMTNGFRHDEAPAEMGRAPAVTTIHPEDIDPPQMTKADTDLGSVSAEDRPAPAAADDRLEIPSFLRRQAN